MATKAPDDLILLGLLSGQSVADVARSLDIDPQTVWRRLRQREFVQRLSEARAEVLRAGLDRLVNHVTRAADVLVGLLDSETEKVQLAAAREILTLGRGWVVDADALARLADLERRMLRPRGSVGDAQGEDEDDDEGPGAGAGAGGWVPREVAGAAG